MPLNTQVTGQLGNSSLNGTYSSPFIVGHDGSQQDLENQIHINPDLVHGLDSKPVPSISHGPDLVTNLQERDILLQSFVKATLETNFEQNIWLVKRTYWAFASRRLGKHFITTRISHWIFEYIAEERLAYEQRQKIPTDLEKARKWVTDYVKVKNTHHKVPIFRYVRMVQPKLQSQGGQGHTELVMKILGLSSVEPLYWDQEELEKQASEDREVEIMQQKQRTLMRQLQNKTDEANAELNAQNPDGTPVTTPTPKKRRSRKRKTEEEDGRRRRGKRGEKEETAADVLLDMASTFPPFEVWEDDDSYLVALQVPAIDRSTLEHKISIVGLEVSGSCSMPIVITKKWPGAFDWYPRKWQRQIVFPKPIDPNVSGLVDITCEGMLFYKCPKQTIHTVNLTNTIKLQEQ